MHYNLLASCALDNQTLYLKRLRLQAFIAMLNGLMVNVTLRKPGQVNSHDVLSSFKQQGFFAMHRSQNGSGKTKTVRVVDELISLCDKESSEGAFCVMKKKLVEASNELLTIETELSRKSL